MVFFLWQPQQTNIGIIHWNRMNQQRLWVAGPIVKRRWSDSHGVNLFYLVCRLAGKWILLLRDKQELLFLLHVLRMVIYLGDLTCGNKVEKGICGFFWLKLSQVYQMLKQCMILDLILALWHKLLCTYRNHLKTRICENIWMWIFTAPLFIITKSLGNHDVLP